MLADFEAPFDAVAAAATDAAVASPAVAGDWTLDDDCAQGSDGGLSVAAANADDDEALDGSEDLDLGCDPGLGRVQDRVDDANVGSGRRLSPMGRQLLPGYNGDNLFLAAFLAQCRHRRQQ